VAVATERDRLRGMKVSGLPRDPSEGDDGRVYGAYTRALWDEQDEPMRRLHRVWTQNLLFLSGNQWIKEAGETFIPQLMAEWREQPVDNVCLAFFRTFLAKATKSRPAWEVIPGNPADPEDVKSATLADELLEAKWIELGMARKYRNAVSWMIATGNAFLLAYWNTDTGNITRLEAELSVPVYDKDGNQTGSEVVMVPLDEDGEPILGEDGRPKPGAEPHVIDVGDVGVKVISPFAVRVNPEAEDEDEVQWLIVAEAATLRELANRADVTDEQFRLLVGEDVGALENADRIFSSLDRLRSGGVHNTPSDSRDDDMDKVLLLHYYERPSIRHPQGRHWVCTRDTLIGEPGTLPDGVWPVMVHLRDVAMPGNYYASSVMEHIVGLNRRLNELNGQIAEHHNLLLKGKWLAPKGSGIRKGMITNQPGEVIQYNPGFKPEQADLKSLPSSVYAEREKILQAFEMVSGIHKVSMGRAPPGVTAGVAFLQLQEADDTDLAPVLAMLEESVADLAHAILKLAQSNYQEDRLIRLVGKNRRHYARAFQQSQLDGVFDVVPVAESSYPWSKTARQSMLLSLAAQFPQLFVNEETGAFDGHLLAEQLPIGGLDAISRETDLDLQEAEREVEEFARWNGQEPLPEPQFWQNFAIHYRVKCKILKGTEFLEWDPQAQEAFKQHVSMHQQARDSKMQQAAQLNAMQQGNLPAGASPGMSPMGGMNPAEELQAMAGGTPPEMPVDEDIAAMMADAYPQEPAEFQDAGGLGPGGDLLIGMGG
jgi:hypothetical protein